jgi:Tfp pilus assembly protein PilF
VGPGPPNMRMRIALVALLLVGLAAPAFADRRSDAKDQVNFGMMVAQKNLWKDAVSRWERAVELDPTYAAAWNDLAIGYEQLGKFDEARKAYEKALALDPGNQFIRNNYDQFRDVYDRQNRRIRR